MHPCRRSDFASRQWHKGGFVRVVAGVVAITMAVVQRMSRCCGIDAFMGVRKVDVTVLAFVVRDHIDQGIVRRRQ